MALSRPSIQIYGFSLVVHTPGGVLIVQKSTLAAELHFELDTVAAFYKLLQLMLDFLGVISQINLQKECAKSGFVLVKQFANSK